MNFKSLITFSIIVKVIISKNELYYGEDENLDLIPGEEKFIWKIKPILDFNLPIKEPNNNITITIPNAKPTIRVEYCKVKALYIVEYIECINRVKAVQLTEKATKSEYIITGNFTVNTHDYKYAIIHVATNNTNIEYLKIKVDQNAGSFISIGLTILTALLSFI